MSTMFSKIIIYGLNFHCTMNSLGDKVTDFFFNLHSGGWNQGPLDTAAT
jgi:hypothetical protein